MEDHSSYAVTQLLASLPLSEVGSLAVLRHWENLQVARTEDALWLKGFMPEQAASPLLQQLPHLHVFHAREGLLFTKGRLLPQRKTPTGLLWTAIAEAFPVSFEKLNHNFFGVNDPVDVRLLSTHFPHEATALLTSLSALRDAVETLATPRLQNLSWTILGNDALLVGTPLLPLPGQAYWQRGPHLLPAGFDFEFPIFARQFGAATAIEKSAWILWQTGGDYVFIPPASLAPLSRSSVRLSLNTR